MSDVISEMRREAGEKAGRTGEKLHEDASQEFKESYRRGAFGFGGSNVMPHNFGKGADTSVKIWLCVCGHENRSNRVARKGGDVVCWICGVPQSYGEDHE